MLRGEGAAGSAPTVPWPNNRAAVWDLEPSAKLADGDIGYTKLFRDLLGRPLPYHGEELFAGDLSLHHPIQFKMKTLEGSIPLAFCGPHREPLPANGRPWRA